MIKKDQIEKMTKDYYGYSIDSEADCKFVAEEMYNKGHRKLSEDSVVLSREEYEKLRETIADFKYDKFDLKNEISEKDNKIALLEETIDCIKFNVGFARKETAREILNELIDSSNKITFFDCRMALGLDKLAKQFGLEVEE